MDVQTLNNASDYLKIMQPYLLEREAENNLMLSVCLDLNDRSTDLAADDLFLVVRQDTKPVLACIMTPPRNLILCANDPVPDSAFELLIDHLIDNSIHIPGVIGKTSLTDSFASLWVKKTGAKARIGMDQEIYVLTQVQQQDLPKGEMKQATPAEKELLLKWFDEFHAEALAGMDTIDLEMVVSDAIAKGSVYLWVDGQPVCMADVARKMINGVCISYVYTPASSRRKGYASALTACLSQLMLNHGFDYCCLYTDKKNPTSNHIYQEIGYTPICDSNVYLFG